MEFKELVKTITRTLVLLLAPGSVTELRIPRARGGPLVGLFNDIDEMAETAAEYSGKVPGIYVVLNQLKKSAGRRVDNQLTKATSAVKDSDIELRRWLPIDLDPVRPSDTCSTDAEHDAAIALAKECRTWLRDQGWPDPLLATSGNGSHLLYRVDLPNDAPENELIKDCLEAISLKFSNSEVLVDTANSNASRIWRIYGTLNCKGTNTEERPYRRAKFLRVPEEIEVVSRQQLSDLALAVPISTRDSWKEQLDMPRWIESNKIPVLADATWKGAGHKWAINCPWNKSHRNRSAYIVQFPDGGIAAGCLHKSCKGNDWPALRAQFEPQSGASKPSEVATQSENRIGGKKAKPAGILLGLRNELELFHTPQGEAYATVRIKGHNENHPIKSRAFEDSIRYKYFLLTGTAPRPQDLREAIAHFNSIAMFDSSVKSISLRVAEAGGLHYLDLGDEQWRAVEFGPTGWRIVDVPVVKFRRTAGMLPLPIPVRGGDFNELKKFLNLRSDDDWLLFAATILQALFPRGPYPVLGLHGEAGSAKSTGSRVFRMMVDPNTSPARAMPKDVRDLAIAANNSSVLIFDNLSYLPGWFSDCLCRFSTGGGFATRRLYTDADEAFFDGQRPIILNGVEELASRTDLVDRSIILDLKVIRSYEPERKFWERFQQAHPALLGALLDVAVDALRKQSKVRLAETPRMADFAIIATAAESALGFAKGRFMEAYRRNRQNANAIALEASPIANVVSDLVKRRPWSGTAAELLIKVSELAGEDVRKQRSWPKNPRMLSGMLRRLATALRRAGIDVEFDRENSAARARKITIRMILARKKRKLV